MKKVGLVTCYFKHNYGSMLQAYATQKFLNNHNISNETISIENNIDFKRGKRKYYLSKIFDYSFIHSKFGMIKTKIYKRLNKELKNNISIRDKQFNEFKNEFNLSIKCHNYKELADIAKIKYSDIIVGSDQLWLPVNVIADYYTLNWVPSNINKISYSTSFGISKIPNKYKKVYSTFLNKINYISVRENDGKTIINELINKKVPVVCDPTILLSKEEWCQIAVKNRIVSEKYILCYFLGKNKKHRQFAEKLKKLTGYKIVSINHCDEYVRYSDIYADIIPYKIGPKEWLNLVLNAEYICTDSFHGTVFSIIFNKQFFCFERHNSKNKNSTNSRLDSLLNVLEIDNHRKLTGDEDIVDALTYKLDYKKINSKLFDFRDKSENWLLKHINYSNDEKFKHINISDKTLCSGCTACKNVCPVKAINMVEDEEGFLYPKVDLSKCINCGLCKKTCPILYATLFKNEFQEKAFIFQNKNIDIRKNSTSGGFYTALGEYIIKNNGIVYGAAFDDNYKVIHTSAKNITDLKKFQKSKYVQSNLKLTFQEVKANLDKNILVCYSGTPCQIAGLKAFLKKEYKNLITVDIMCHSVPSPLFFEKYKKYILTKMKASKIYNIDFRDKSKYGYKYSMMTIKTNNGIYSNGIDKDPFLRAFFSDLIVRPSCYNCKFKTIKRVSDFTIWDCFNIKDISKDFDDDIGTTRILVHTHEGLEILKKVNNVKLKEIELNTAIKNVKEMTNSVTYNINRNNIFNDIEDINMIEKYFPQNLKTNLNSFIRKILCITGLYDFIKSNLKKILRK